MARIGIFGIGISWLFLACAASAQVSQKPLPGLDLNNAFTGNNTHSGTETFKNLENVRMVEPTNAAGWAGTDVGAWINSACKDLPAAGGIVYVNGFTTATANNTDWVAGCTATKITVQLGVVNLLMNQAGTNPWTVNLAGGWHVNGSGPGISVLKLNSNVAFVRIFNVQEGASDWGVDWVELNGNFPTVNEASQQNHCIFTRDATRGSITRNYIHDCNGSGVQLWGAGIAGTAFTNEAFGTGNGTLTSFRYTVLNPQIKPGSVTVTAGAVSGIDSAAISIGTLSGAGIKGDVNYDTGEIEVIFTTAPANLQAITVNYTGGAGAQQATTNVKVLGNFTKNNINGGIACISCRDVDISDNYDNTIYSFEGVHLEPSGTNQYLINVNVHDNHTFGNGGISATCQVQGLTTQCRNNKFNGNHVNGGHLKIQRHIDTSVSNNTCLASLDAGSGCIQLIGRDYTATGNIVGPPAVALTSGISGGIYHDCTSTNDTSGAPAGTGRSIISGNKIDGFSLNGIMDNNCSGDIISNNHVKNTTVALANANGIRISNSVANLSDKNLVIGNRADDDQAVATQKNGFLLDPGVTNTLLLSNSGSGNTTVLVSDSGTGTIRLDDTTTVTLAGTQTLPNKTLINPVINGVNAQTGTTYTFVAGDEQKLVTFNNAAAVAVTLPQATTTGFGAGTSFHVRNLGVGTVTITPTASTIDSAASVAYTTGQGADIYSDGTNYVTQKGAAAGGVTVTHFDATGLTNNTGPTTILTPGANGLYRFTVESIITTVATTSSTLPGVQVQWTDADNGTAQTSTQGGSPTTNVLTTFSQGTTWINAKSAVAIKYQTLTYASSPANQMAYSIHGILEGPF